MIRVLTIASESMMVVASLSLARASVHVGSRVACYCALLVARNQRRGVPGPGGECCYNRRGEWWVRLSIDTEHMGRPEEALEVTRSNATVPRNWEGALLE